MRAGFHYHETSLGHGFQLIRGHEGALHHLGTGSCCPCPESQSRTEPFGCPDFWTAPLLTVGAEAARDGVYGVARTPRTLFSVIFSTVPTLDNGHKGQSSRTAP